MKLKLLLIGICAGLPTFVPAATEDAPKTFLQENFDTAEQLDTWSKSASAKFAGNEGIGGAGCVRFDLPAGEPAEDAMISKPLDLGLFRGKTIKLSAMMKGQDITQPEKHYLGPKLMIYFNSPAGKQWIDQAKKTGTYDWESASVTMTIPNDADEITLIIGLQQCRGTLWMDDLKITEEPPPPPTP